MYHARLQRFSCTVYMLLYLYDVFHILQSFLTNIRSRECNVMYVCMYVVKCDFCIAFAAASLLLLYTIHYSLTKLCKLYAYSHLGL
jgi:hypothetical protein